MICLTTKMTSSRARRLSRGANGSAVLVFGHGLYNASVALLLCEMLELGWRSKRNVLEAPLEPGGLLLVSSESVRYFDAPTADE